MDSEVTSSTYQIGEVLARSRHHVVSRATRESDGLCVVIKHIAESHPSERVRLRLLFEHRVLTKLAGPGIIRALELTKLETGPALVLEDFEAQSLALAGRLEPLPLLDVALQASRALARVHAAGIIHKDIKPANMLRNSTTGELKLIDFQLATELLREHPAAAYCGTLEGSLAYIAPEQTGRMNRSVDYRADFYSLGVALYQLATGYLPLEAADATGWVHAHLSRAPRLATDVNPEVPLILSKVFSRLLQKDPAARYQSSAGLIADLERCRSALERGQRTIDFELGTSDVSERFQVAQRLIGREGETEPLLRAFDEASRGCGQLLIVSGYSGVGKSSLIREIYKPVAIEQGRLVFGKFDQLERHVPFAALSQALTDLVRGLLTEPDEDLRRWQDRISRALGANARVMLDLVPELASVIGPHPPAPPLSASESLRRFKTVVADFLRLFAEPSHPLVIVLDDMQWTDASTPDLVADLLLNQGLQHLLLIAAYRDNEVTTGHLFSMAVQRIREERPELLREIAVAPLKLDAVTTWTAESLRTSPQAARPLAEVLFDKTQGNPFFLTALLESLHRQGAITLCPDTGQWSFDLEEVRKVTVTENVVDLLLGGLAALPSEARHILSVAACVGNQFGLDEVAALSDLPPARVAAALWTASEQGIVEPLTGDYRLAHLEGLRPATAPSGTETSAPLRVLYRFRHDRVQQAAYALIPEGDRPSTHLRLGWRLLETTSKEAAKPKTSLSESTDGGPVTAFADVAASSDERLFEVVNHLNLGRGLIEETADLRLLLELNCRAGKKAREATAYTIGAAHFAVALDLCSVLGEPSERDFALRYQWAETLQMAGEHVRASEVCSELESRASEPLSKASVQLLRARILEACADFVASVNAVRRGLALLGVHLPESPAEIEQAIGSGIERMQTILSRVEVDALPHLPDLEDPNRMLAAQLLFQVIPAATQTFPPLFILSELILFELAVEHGLTPFSAKNFVDCGIIQGGILGRYDVAYAMGKAAFQVLERYGNRAVASGVHFVFAAYVSSWRAHWSEAFTSFDEGYRAGAETGDVQHMGFCVALRLHRLLYVGKELSHVREELRTGVEFLERSRLPSQRTATIQVECALSRLQGSRDGSNPMLDEARATERVHASKNPQWIYAYAESQMVVSVLLGDYAQAQRWGKIAEPLLPQVVGLISLTEYTLCELLVLSQHEWPQAEEQQRPPLLERARQLVAKLRIWRDACPENFEHKYQLAMAELGRLECRPLEEVVGHYECAASSTGNSFIHMCALARELQASYWSSRNNPVLAAALLEEALRLYGRWGASTKAAALRGELRVMRPTAAGSRSPKLDLSATRTVSPDTAVHAALDVESVLKAARAVASEVHGEKLFCTLMTTLLETAAAERGALILPTEEGSLQVEAHSEGVTAGVTVEARPLESARTLSGDVIRYVARTHKPVVVDDARADDLYNKDSYIVSSDIKSLLCLPVLHRGRLVAIFYAENNAATHVFSSERVATLHLIAGQAAVSLVNARLYDNLESKVQERTRELATKNREISALLDGMDHGVFSIDPELRILAQYSRRVPSLLQSSELAGRPVIPLLFAGSRLSRDAIDATEAALNSTFHSPASMAGLNASRLVKAFSRPGPGGGIQHFQVDWRAIEGHDDSVEKFVVVVRDVTELERAKANEERRAWESDLVSSVLSYGVEIFRGFCSTARARIESALSALEATGPLEPGIAAELMRDLHTLKGNARSLELQRLVDTVHEAEASFVASASGEGYEVASVRALREKLLTLKSDVAEHERIAASNLGPLWSQPDGALQRAFDDINRVLDTGTTRPSYPARALLEIKRTVHRAQSVPLSEIVRGTSRCFESVARELGKHPPELEWNDSGVRLTRTWGQVLEDALTHTFRNCLDHGIEPTQERLAQGKPERGRIRLFTEQVDGRFRIVISDDGRGLDLERLRQRAPDQVGADETLAGLVFSPGMSTASQITTVSGRGVGLHAVRSFVREHGGDVGLSFTGQLKNGRRPFQLVLDLPERALVQDT